VKRETLGVKWYMCEVEDLRGMRFQVLFFFVARSSAQG